MFPRRDRRELGVLGLLVLAWGLLAAPLLHTVVSHGAHSHGGATHQHSVPATPSSMHGEGSVEHLLASFVASSSAVLLVLVLISLERPELRAPFAPQLEAVGGAAMPQGP